MKWAIAIAALALAGCAADPFVDPVQFEILDQEQCVSWGAAIGTQAHAQCRTAMMEQRTALIERQAASRAATAARFSAAGAAMTGSRPAQSPTPITTTCFARGESTSGMNKICYYDCLGSRAAVTQSSVSLCPITIQQ